MVVHNNHHQTVSYHFLSRKTMTLQFIENKNADKHILSQTSINQSISGSPTPQASSVTIKDFFPLFEALIWPFFWITAFLVFRKQLLELLDSLLAQVKEGASVKVGLLEVSPTDKVVKETADLDEVKTVGNPDRFQLLIKAKGISEGNLFKKSTKAMQVPNGCIVQVTTERQNPDGSWSIAEALTFVPGKSAIKDDVGNGKFIAESDE
jgi:hypothetical protein